MSDREEDRVFPENDLENYYAEYLRHRRVARRFGIPDNPTLDDRQIGIDVSLDEMFARIVGLERSFRRVQRTQKRVIDNQIDNYFTSPEFEERCLRLLRGLPPKSRGDAVADLKKAFSSLADVEGVYVRASAQGYDVIVTYPEEKRLGEILKALVPTEIELLKKYGNTFDFEYVPSTSLSDDLKSSYQFITKGKA